MPTNCPVPTSPLGSALPPEILLEVFRHLKPADSADRSALLALLRVSSSVFRLAASVLYNTVQLDVLGLRLLLGASLDLDAKQRADFLEDDEYREMWFRADFVKRFGPLVLSDRTRKCLQLIRDLTLLAPLHSLDVFMLWLAPLPSGPLFGNVRRFTFKNNPAFRGAPVPMEGPEHPDPGLLLFNVPDACISGSGSFSQFPLLLARRWKSITLHDSLPSLRERQVVTPWSSFRMFSRDVPPHQFELWADTWSYLDAVDPKRRLPPAQVHVKEIDFEYMLEELAGSRSLNPSPGPDDSQAAIGGLDSGSDSDSEVGSISNILVSSAYMAVKRNRNVNAYVGDIDGLSETDTDGAGDESVGDDDENDTDDDFDDDDDEEDWSPQGEALQTWNILSGKKSLGPRLKITLTRQGDEEPSPCLVCSERSLSTHDRS